MESRPRSFSFGGEKDTEEGMLKEMHEFYPGNVVSAHDLDVY